MMEPDHALSVLEFGRVLDVVAKRAVSEAGAADVRGLRPLGSRALAARTLEAVDELQAQLTGADRWNLEAFPDLAGTLRKLSIPDASLEAQALVDCAAVMATARSAKSLERQLSPDGIAGKWVAQLWGDVDLEKRIARTFDESGAVADRASPELKRIRRSLVDGRARLVERLDRYARELPERVRVPDASVTVRNGRYCVPLRREGKGAVGGLVHDASASRQTLFVEPTIAIEAMNEIRELEIAEVREVMRILRALSGEVSAVVRELAGSYEALVQLDSLRARARVAQELGASSPDLFEGAGPIEMRGARHPLLALMGDGAVPFDLVLAPNERVLLVSGPNAGGKTVLLKAFGLTAALAQSGVVPPVAPGTRLPFFRRLFAVIGDEQSIDASLSTFGAQAKNLAEILIESTAEDLVLIDEIGSATDPAEGGALAAATLTRLSTQARLTIATTHLGDLKRLEDEGAATVNASLQFDSERLEPTYRLVRDRPGRSYALVIAARLGVPEDVLADARARLDAEHVSLDTLLERLEGERIEVEGLREQLEERADRLRDRENSLVERETRVAAEVRAATREREEARNQALKEARATIAETIDALEVRYGERDSESRAEAKRSARGTVERAIRESGAALAGLQEVPSPAGDASTPRVGETVRWHDSKRSGVLVEIRGDRGVVSVDGLRLKVPLSDLLAHPMSVGARQEETVRPVKPRSRSGTTLGPEFVVSTEVDLRGLRVDEVEAVLFPALDAAVVAELPWLRIIHGKGTGALREVVQELLSADGRIPSFRPGESNEGGTGVTVVDFEERDASES